MNRNKHKMLKTDRSHTSAIVAGILVALLLSVLLTALITNFVLTGHLSEKIGTAATFAVRTISTLVGALIGAAVLKGDYLKLVGFISAGYLIAITGLGILLFDGSFKNFLFGVLSVLIGGIAALLIIQMPKHNGRKHKKISL